MDRVGRAELLATRPSSQAAEYVTIGDSRKKRLPRRTGEALRTSAGPMDQYWTRCLSTLLPITAPATPPSTPPTMAPRTRWCPPPATAPITAPPAAPMAASRRVCFTVYVCGWRYTGPAYEPLLLPELRRVLRWRVDEDEWCVVLEVAGFSATLASACGWAAGCGTGTWFSSTGLAAATGCAGCTIMLSSQVSWGCVWAVFASRPQAAAPTSVDIITATLRTRIGLLLLWD